MLKKLEQWIFPSQCCLCGVSRDLSAESPDFCRVCIEQLPWVNSGDRCVRCGLCLTWGTEAVYCEPCRIDPPAFDRLYQLFAYEEPIKTLLSRFKFSGQMGYGPLFAGLLAQKIQKHWYATSPYDLPQAIIPVPLHLQRLAVRGFNQALELSLPLAQRLKCTLWMDGCIRIKNTQAQSRLERAARKTNLKDAFFLRTEPDFDHCAIVDDVVTTGSTVNALSKLLKDAGVSRVDVWCVARA